MMRTNKLRLFVALPVAALLVIANFQISLASTSTNVDKYFAALRSAQPLKIEDARKKYIAPNSSADIFTKMIINHFKGTEYLKTLDKFGNVSPSAHDAPGKVSKSKNGVFTIDSSFNTIDGSYKDFVLNKSQKISSFKIKTASSNYVSVKDNIQLLTINYNEGGIEIKSGIHWRLPTGYSFVQVDFSNIFGGFKSWSYARGCKWCQS
jgi:hypothetical protein